MNCLWLVDHCCSNVPRISYEGHVAIMGGDYISLFRPGHEPIGGWGSFCPPCHAVPGVPTSLTLVPYMCGKGVLTSALTSSVWWDIYFAPPPPPVEMWRSFGIELEGQMGQLREEYPGGCAYEGHVVICF